MPKASLPTSLTCAGCGVTLPADAPHPYRCPKSGRGDIDHVLVRRLDLERISFEPRLDEGVSENPFIDYRDRLHTYHRARAAGMTDEQWIALVRRLDDAVAEVDRRRFRTTPFFHSRALTERLNLGADGAVLVKNEIGNVSGSHKARHLFGILLHLEWRRELGLETEEEARTPLAIASCGNAALAAAVLARAAERPLKVFVPTSADPTVVERLRELGAEVVECPRNPDEAGDPSYLRFREAVEAGATPFTCQGPDNGLTIEGGTTLGYELLDGLAAKGLEVDRVIIQVGGGAVGSAVFQAFVEAHEAGRLERLPRLHTVQTEGAWPVARAWDAVARRAEANLAGETPGETELVSRWSQGASAERERRADALKEVWGEKPLKEALVHATRNRSEFMRPWESEPKSVAHGILDDETYDWQALVKAMLRSGGHPVVVTERLLKEANGLAREATGAPVDHTGSASLAGLMALKRGGVVRAGEKVVVLFTGIDRAEERRLAELIERGGEAAAADETAGTPEGAGPVEPAAAEDAAIASDDAPAAATDEAQPATEAAEEEGHPADDTRED